MADTLEIYKELEKARHSSSSSRDSLHDPSRYSIDSNDHDSVDELDPLRTNGTKQTNGNGSLAYPNGRRGSSPLPVFNRRGKLKDGRSRWRAALESYIPLGTLERILPLGLIRRIFTPRKLRRLRRPLLPFGRSPGRILCFAATLIALLLLLMTASAGVYVIKKGTIDGQSPPWYPTPRGGTVQSWAKSYEKAAALVRQMTLAEKVNITTGTGWMMGMCVGNTGPALGVKFPSLCLQDGPLGLRFADQITAAPAGVTVGATWNKELMKKRGVMLGLEARHKGVNVLLGPSVGPLGKMPAGGRNWEGFGADPVLQGIAAAETIKGIQGEGVMATIKHFVGNEQEHYRQSFEWGLPNAISSNIDDRTLHELYAWPFADSIRAGVASVMCSYNQVNNSYSCQNSKLMNGILKDELGFQGFVQSDWVAQRSGVASALAGLDMSMPGDGSRMANGKPYWGQHLSRAVLNGTVPLQRINDMVTRIVAAWYQVGQDDKSKWPLPPPDGEGGPNFSSWTDEEVGLLHPGSNDKSTGRVNKHIAANKGRSSHRSLVRQIAAEGIVLLKNDNGILPLHKEGGSLKDFDESFINPNMHKRQFHVGVYGEDAANARDGPNVCADRGCNKGTLATGWGSGAVDFPYLVSPWQALKDWYHEEKVVLASSLTNKLPSGQNNSQIEYQDLCMVFANADGGEGFIRDGTLWGDRNDLYLQKDGDKLIKDVAKHCGIKNSRNKIGTGADTTYKNSPTIVVIHSVGPVILESFIKDPNIQAVLYANLPGQESGNSLIDVLNGKVNPSGRLPYTIGRKIEDYGPGGQILYITNPLSVPQQNFSEGQMVDYRYFDSQNIKPRFEFGYGLSYTSFTLKDLKIKQMSDSRPSSAPPSRPSEESKPPDFDGKPPDAKEVLFPPNFRKLKKYIYPYLSDVKGIKYSANASDVTPSPQSQAGGGEGGNPALWETLAKVEASLTNTGDLNGQAVVQLYVKFPEDYHEEISDHDGTNTGSSIREKIVFPPKVLRGFEKVHAYTLDSLRGLSHGDGFETKEEDAVVKVRFDLTRRDLSYWSVRKQNWIIPDGQFEIHVGFSSRKIELKGTLF